MNETSKSFSWDSTWQGKTTKLDLTRSIMWKKLCQHVKLQQRSYMEIGAGSGVFGKLALEAGATQICLLDNSKNAIQMCKNYLGEHPQATYVLADAFTYEPEETFDVVISNGLIEHFLDQEQADIVQAHVRCSHDLVVFMVPASPHFNDRRCKYPWALKKYGPQYPISKEQMKAVLDQANLETVVIERFYPMYSIRLKRLFAKEYKLFNFIDPYLSKIGLYHLLTWLTNPFGRWWGGYLIGVGRVKNAQRENT